MKTTLMLAVCLAAVPAVAFAAEEEPGARTNMKEALRARMAQDAAKKPAAPATKDATKNAVATSAEPTTREPESASPPAAAVTNEKRAESAVSVSKGPATVLPKVEVKKDRITILDQKLAEQEREIARERKNLKASEVDTALNDAKIAKPLAIFGGDSAQFRQRVAAERVELMEAEKDLLEAIAHARTKEEKLELQKQLDEIKAMRRQLDKSLR